MSQYYTSTPVDLGLKLGERLSVMDFVPSASKSLARTRGIDMTSYIQTAITAAMSSGGCDLYFPRGDYSIATAAGVVLDNTVSNMRFIFDGNARLWRDATITAGSGVWNVVGATDIVMDGIQIDGVTNAPTQVNYSTFSDPMDNQLTRNTSIWVKAGSKRITIKPRITHTGGYAVLIDARTGDIEDVWVRDGAFRNNYPHTFGITAGDLGYGSWTGGIHYQSDGTNYQVRRLRIVHNDIRRSSGTGCWGHSYAFNKPHKDIIIDGNYVEDVGFHGVQLGNVDGAIVANNTTHRTGYVTIDDTSQPLPKYLADRYASAIDMAGAQNANIHGNRVLSPNGDGFDLDGLAYSTLTGNYVSIPLSTEKAYIDDLISQIGPGSTGLNYSYGMQTGSTFSAIGGTSVTIQGNRFRNLGGGAIRLYGARNCSVKDNHIESLPQPSFAPIVMGHTASNICNGNVVSNNTILYSPSGGGATYGGTSAIYEDPQLAAFNSGDKNWVFNNHVISSGIDVIEFKKDPNSASISEVVYTTSTGATPNSSIHTVARTGQASNSSSALQWNLRENGTNWEHMQLQGYWKSGSRGPLLNVSEGGVGGVVSTGGRTSVAFTDVVATGKLYGDSFLALNGVNFLDADANLLDSTYGLMRFLSASGAIEYSVATSTGARVWLKLGAAGLDKQVQYFKSGSGQAADANFTWDYTTKLLQVTAAVNTAGINVVNGYVQSDKGFASQGNASTTVNVPAGGVTALSLISIRNDGGAGLTLSRTAAVARTYSLNVDLNGALLVYDATAASTRAHIDTSGVFWVGTSMAMDQSGNLTMSGVLQLNTAASGINLTAATGLNSIQTTGGIRTDIGVYLKASSASPTSFSGHGGLAYNSGSSYWYWNGTAWALVNLASAGGGGVTSVAGGTGVTVTGTTAVTVSIGQAVGTGSAVSFYSLVTTDAIQSNRTTGPAIYAPNAYIQAKGLLSTGLTANNSIQSDSGITALGGFFVGTSGGTAVVDSSGNFVGPGVLTSGGVGAAGFNPTGFTGQSFTLDFTFQIGGVTYNHLRFVGGVFVSAS